MSVDPGNIEHMFEKVVEWQQGLAAALAEPSGLDDAARVETIRALEALVCTATAAQAAFSAELDESQRAAQAVAGVPKARRGRGVAHQVALARRESPHRGQRHLALARIVRDELPHTWAAWRTGRVTEWAATLIARETACLTREDRAGVDAEVAGDADRLAQLSLGQLVGACQAEAARLDAASLVARRRKAEGDRHVSLRAAPDTMVRLSALLPVKDGVAAFAALSRTADAARAAGDERSRGQVMADSLVGAVLEFARQRDHDVTRWTATSDQSDSSAKNGQGVSLGVVMTDSSLFGESEDPALLDGYGPIPAELAREVVADALSGDERVWLRRLYTSPASGELVTMDSHARRFPQTLARFIRLRDQVCRTPWCDAPIRHLDHVESHAARGPTSGANGQGLCEACNHAKQAPGWRARPSPVGGPHEVETSTPTGHVYRSRAPVVATVRHAPIRVDYVLAT